MTPDAAALLDALRAGPRERAHAVAVLRTGLDAGRARARQRLEAGEAGVAVARLYSAAADTVVRALWDWVSDDVYPAPNPSDTAKVAVLAVGGYGRGVLAPFSDLDLLFLRPWKSNARFEQITEFILYVLWDLGLKVGWAARSVDECLKLARADMTIRTTLLEARPLAGDPTLAETFLARFQKEAARADPRPFIAAKLAERDVRHEKAGASRYRVEPNVKEGKGGLRDLNTLFWIARSLAPESPLGRRALEGLLTPREQRGVEQAFDFLWSVRIWLHLIAGRAEEKLTFDVQTEIARRMGFRQEAGETAVERFMRRYFLTARDVGGLTRAFCAKLEADRNKAPQGIAGWFAKKVKRTPLDLEGFVEEGGRLVVEDPAILDRDPVNLIRLFRTADHYHLDLHPDAFTAVTRRLGLVTPRLRRDPGATRAFLDILAEGSQPYRVLTLMNETGLLGRFLPEFGRVVGQTQLNMYHAYTVDEHTLRAIGTINDIQRGKHEEDHPLSTAIMPHIADREALFLAMLLHDTGKGGTRGQEDDGSIAAARACERLGLPRGQVELVAWLVRHHLVLSDYAQKRDVSDPETVAAFARIVENPERLRLLLVLTVADIRAVGPGVWNGWKGRLMRELYAATEAVFRGGRSSDAAASFRQHQADQAAAAREALGAADPSAAAWAASMEDAYFTAFEAEDHRRHAALAARGAAADARFRADHNAAELTVAAPDRPGLFADLARALAAMGADVVGARVFTSAGGQALDVFYLQDAAGEPFGRRHKATLERACRALEAASRGQGPSPEASPASGIGRRAPAFDITPTVTIDNEAAREATIIEVSGRDRPGLLADLARTLSEAGLSIRSAHIDSYGERAVDAFYVRDETSGRRVTDPAALLPLRTALNEVLTRAEAREARPRLARATARAGR
ncbi:MAG: [protein-PII] uridylyltransferase [Caulobacteraceae bacterium]|nr:[protein-PII] uridylyltransferase [Caulobacteraceae bacterium]